MRSSPSTGRTALLRIALCLAAASIVSACSTVATSERPKQEPKQEAKHAPKQLQPARVDIQQDATGFTIVEDVRVGADVLEHPELRSEAHDLDVEIFVDRFQLLAQRDEMLVTAEQPPQQAGELDDEHARRVGLGADER